MRTAVRAFALAQLGDLAPIHLFLIALAGIAVVMIAIWIISAGVSKGVREANVRQAKEVEATSAAGGFPVVLEEVVDSPGTFRVTGVDRQSTLDVTEHIAAESAANAKVKAELRGIVVTKVDRV